MKTMVCVTAQKTCERLIHEGSRIAQETSDGLSVLHVAATDAPLLGAAGGDAGPLEFLYRIVREYNADMTVIRDDHPIEVLVAHAQKFHAQCIVLGTSGGTAEPFAQALALRLPGVDVRIIP